MNAFTFLISTITVVTTTFQSLSQVAVISNKPNDWGTVSMQTASPHKFKAQFAQYEKLSNITFENCGTILYVAPHDGELNINANTAKEDLDVVVFRAESTNFDQELALGTAFILSYKQVAKGENFSASITDKNDFNESTRFQIMKGQTILIFANSRIATTLDFTPEIKKVKSLEAREGVDPFEFRKNKAGKTLKIVARDNVTGLPLNVKLSIQGLKGLENVYSGTDFTFDMVSGKGAIIACSAEGYFNNAVTPKFISGQDNVITVVMTSFKSKGNMRLDGVQFIEGTAEPLPNSFKELDKLVEFMKSNPTIKIEVQGHVNAPDKGSRAAEKLSQGRASYVRDYLIRKGIEANRVQAKGYGNTKMVFENPKNEQEEQANRRVEIRIYE